MYVQTHEKEAAVVRNALHVLSMLLKEAPVAYFMEADGGSFDPDTLEQDQEALRALHGAVGRALLDPARNGSLQGVKCLQKILTRYSAVAVGTVIHVFLHFLFLCILSTDFYTTVLFSSLISGK